MHKFYWRNTHGPGAARRPEDQTIYRMGKSGSADNILSEVSLASLSVCLKSFNISPSQSSSSAPHPPDSGLSLVRRMRRLSGRSARPKSVADIADTEDELAENLANLRLANSAAQEFSSIEQLEAAQYGQTYSRPQYGQVRSARSLGQGQVRPSRSLYFSEGSGAEERSRTWNHGSVRRYRQAETEFYPARQHKRLSVSSFRYSLDNGGDTASVTSTTTATSTEQRNAFKQKVQRSLSCERTKQASKQVVKSIKISSDKIQENLTKISSNLNSKLDTRLASLSCMAGEETGGVAGTDWYRGPQPEDLSGGFRQSPVRAPVRLTTPTSSLARHHHHQIPPQSPTSSVFSCTKPQVDT